MYDRYNQHPYGSLAGVGVAIATPFHNNGQVDSESLITLTDHIVRGGVDFVTLLGTTGESPTVQHSERLLLMDAVRRTIDNRCRLVVGVGSNDTDKLCHRVSNPIYDMVDALLVVAPYYNKPTQEGIYRHYMAVAEASSRPILLYNIPSRTGVDIFPSTIQRLMRDSSSFIGVKEASQHLERITEIRKMCGADFLILSGDDAHTREIIQQGGDGVISVVANAYPEWIQSMVRALFTGCDALALEIERHLEEVCQLLFVEGNPVGIKGLLEVMGLITSRHVRLPLCPASEELSLRLRSAHDALVRDMSALSF